jgi:hypothetical protein
MFALQMARSRETRAPSGRLTISTGLRRAVRGHLPPRHAGGRLRSAPCNSGPQSWHRRVQRQRDLHLVLLRVAVGQQTDLRSRIGRAGAALPGFNELADGSRTRSPPGCATGSSGCEPVATACCAAAAPPGCAAAVIGPAGSLPLRSSTSSVSAEWSSKLSHAWSAEVSRTYSSAAIGHVVRRGQHAAGQTARRLTSHQTSDHGQAASFLYTGHRDPGGPHNTLPCKALHPPLVRLQQQLIEQFLRCPRRPRSRHDISGRWAAVERRH